MPLSRQKFKQLKQEQFSLRSKLQRATVFYVLNRTSFSGSTLSGGMASGGKNDNPRFTISSIEKLRNFNIKNFSVDFADYRISIPKHEKSLLYLDPPYDIEKPVLYGVNGHLHSNFDHDELFEILKKRDNWIMSYHNSKKAKNRYSDYEIIKPKWNYGMSKDKTSNELSILSHDISKKLLIKQRVSASVNSQSK